MFGISLSEIVVIATIALVVVGPQKLPSMLRTLGQWMRKLRKLTTEVRAQTGIDEILREEGIDGVHELRSLLRGEIAAARQRQRPAASTPDPYEEAIAFDAGREHPLEGPDSYNAVPDDLYEGDEKQELANAPVDIESTAQAPAPENAPSEPLPEPTSTAALASPTPHEPAPIDQPSSDKPA